MLDYAVLTSRSQNNFTISADFLLKNKFNNKFKSSKKYFEKHAFCWNELLRVVDRYLARRQLFWVLVKPEMYAALIDYRVEMPSLCTWYTDTNTAALWLWQTVYNLFVYNNSQICNYEVRVEFSSKTRWYKPKIFYYYALFIFFYNHTINRTDQRGLIIILFCDNLYNVAVWYHNFNK